jgi:hypothetical protein
MILCQHHAPCHEPWMSTYVLIAVSSYRLSCEHRVNVNVLRFTTTLHARRSAAMC